MHIYDLDSNDGVTDMDHVRDTLERMFPNEHECGIIPSVFATVDRTEWAHRRESITAELLEIAEDAIAEERFAPADDDQPLGITARTDGGYLAVLIHDDERVCTLIGCDLDSLSERICDFDPITDKVDTEILAARNGFSTPRPSRIDMVPARENFVRIEGNPDLICDLLGRAVTDREIDSYEVVDDVPVLVDRADLDAFTRAVLGAVHSLDREIERMERGLAILCGPHRDIRLADAETARANLNRLVTILCNATKGGAK
jgi:hypothetical protein